MALEVGTVHTTERSRRGRRLSVGVTGLAAVASLGVLPGVGVAQAATSTSTPLQALVGDVLPGIGQLGALGPATGSTPMTLAVSVAGLNPGGQAAAYQAIYTPGSPDYHHFLTPVQIADRFGAPTSRWTDVQDWLTRGGLHVAYSSPTRDLLELTGTASQVERRFGVSIDRYHTRAADFVANTSAPMVPVDLGITHVLGLNSLGHMTPTHNQAAADHVMAAPIGTGAGALSPTAGLSLATGENIGAQTPQDLWGAYQQPAGAEGAGQSMAMFGEGQSKTIISDLAQFERANGLGNVPVSVVQVGPGPFTDTSGNVEWNIDTQAEVGMAPQASGLTMYFGSDLSDATVASLFSTWEAQSGGPLQANASFGECEMQPVGSAIGSALGSILSNPSFPIGTGLTNDLQPVADLILSKATLQGKTLFSSSGDTGSSCPVVVLPVVGPGNGVVNQVVPFTNYPAASPYAVGVGGTVLYTQSQAGRTTRAQEYAWTFGGGGTSFFIPAPAYQQNTPNLIGRCVVDPSGQPTNTGQLCRGVPDVSAMSGDALTNGYSIISGGVASTGGGTSLSSPLYVGMWTRVQGEAKTSNGNGFANETFYRLGKNPTTHARDFYDITTGLLGVPYVGNGLYPTLPGWDYVTGWGPPQVASMIADVDGVTLTP